MTTETKSELTPAECVFIGQRQTSDGKLSECWIALDTLTKIVADEANKVISDELIERVASRFTVKRGRGGHPSIVGGIYTMNVRIEGDSIQSASLTGKKYVRPYPSQSDDDDNGLVTHWRALDSAAKMEHTSLAQAEKLKSNPPLERELKELRAHYLRLPYKDRAAFELTVLNSLRRVR